MKIAIASDLHLEFNKINLTTFFETKADVLVLAGDTVPAKKIEDHLNFFKRCSESYGDVIYILGNHEYYSMSMPKAERKIRKFFVDNNLTNIHVLQNQEIHIGKVAFLGTTLWTDVGGNNNTGKAHIHTMMNDYSFISVGEPPNKKLLTPDDTIREHNYARRWLRERLNLVPDGMKPFVVTHHAPHFESVGPRFRHDYYGNMAFFSNMLDILDDFSVIWVHGHMHDSAYYKEGQSMVICHPRGYPGEDARRVMNGYSYKPMIIEV